MAKGVHRTPERTSIARRRLEHLARYGTGSLYTLFVRAIGDPEKARDLLQDTLMDAWRNLSRYDSSRRLSAWVFRIGQNRLRNYLRRQRLERKWIRPLEGKDPVQEPESLPGALTREQQELLEEALLCLPHRQRMAVLLRYQEDLSCSEIGDLLDMTANAVSIQLHRARRTLGELLKERLFRDRQ